MQKQKDEIRELILTVARDEFIQHGVRRTSMQTIARKSGVAVGNIYNYFKGKDELLKTVLAPLLNAFEEYRRKNTSKSYITRDIFTNDDLCDAMQNQVEQLVMPYRREMRLLMSECNGTALEDYIKKHLDDQMTAGKIYISMMKEKYPCINADVSGHFLRILCSLWNEVLKEIVMHDDIGKEEIDLLINNYVRFDMGGWKNLLGIAD